MSTTYLSQHDLAVLTRFVRLLAPPPPALGLLSRTVQLEILALRPRREHG